jgi:hypothetical protein
MPNTNMRRLEYNNSFNQLIDSGNNNRLHTDSAILGVARNRYT